jgi:hypothetical protein
MVAAAQKKFARDGRPEALPLFAQQIERAVRDFDAVFRLRGGRFSSKTCARNMPRG